MATKKLAEVIEEDEKNTAKTKKSIPNPAPVSNRVKIKIDRVPGQKEQDDVVISINGKRYQIQRGVEVEVPYEVAAALDLWNRERNDAEELMFQLMN